MLNGPRASAFLTMVLISMYCDDSHWIIIFFFQAEDGIRGLYVTGVQTCALPISAAQPRVGRAGNCCSRLESHSRNHCAAENEIAKFPRLRPCCAKNHTMYSSSRLVTLCLSRVRLPASEKFERGEIGEGLMGPYTVVGFLPASQLLVERGQLIGVGLHFVEFLIVGAVGALHVGVQLR